MSREEVGLEQVCRAVEARSREEHRHRQLRVE